jgi:hypothetical protein
MPIEVTPEPPEDERAELEQILARLFADDGAAAGPAGGTGDPWWRAGIEDAVGLGDADPFGPGERPAASADAAPS